MERPSVILSLTKVLFLFFIISTLLISPAISALFEDDGEEQKGETKTKTKAADATTPLQAGLKLGKEVMDKVNESYYRLWRYANAIDVEYIVEKDGAKAGSLTVHWERDKGIKVKFNGDIENVSLKDMLITNVDQAWFEGLLIDLQPEGKIARKSGDDYIITYYPEDNKSKGDYVLISKDYKFLKTFDKSPEGDIEDVYQVETQDNQHFIKGIVAKSITPDGDLTSKMDITYKREKGKVIISKIDMVMTCKAEGFEGDEVQEYKFSLKLNPEKQVTIKDIATETTTEGKEKKKGEEIEVGGGEEIEVAGGEGELPAGWDDLTKQVVPALYEANLDTAAMIRNVKKASCTITAYITPPGSSTSTLILSYAWEDADNNGLLTADEIDIETKSASDTIAKTSASAIRESIENELQNETLKGMMGAVVKTRKTADGYTMVIEAGKAGVQSISANISNDYRTTKTRIRIKPPKGGTIETVKDFTYKKVGDKWLKTGSKETTTSSGTEIVNTMNYKYDMSTGSSLPVSISSQTTMSVLTTDATTVTTFNLSKWKITKRDTPITVAEVIGGVPPEDTTEEGVEVTEDEGTTGGTSKNEQAKAWCAKATIAGKKKEYDKAIEYFTKGIEIDPKFAHAYAGRGAAYAETGQNDKALADFNKAIELNTKVADFYGMRSIIYGRKKEKDKAMQDIEKALQLNNKCAPAYFARGCINADDGNYDQAISDLQQAKKYGWGVTDEMIAKIKEMQESGTEVNQEWEKMMEEMRQKLINESKNDWKQKDNKEED